MIVQPRRNVTQILIQVYPIIPQPLPSHTRPQIHLLLLCILISQFIPHAGLPTDHVQRIHARLEGVHQTPMLVDEIADIALFLTETLVQIGHIVVG